MERFDHCQQKITRTIFYHYITWLSIYLILLLFLFLVEWCLMDHYLKIQSIKIYFSFVKWIKLWKMKIEYLGLFITVNSQLKCFIQLNSKMFVIQHHTFWIVGNHFTIFRCSFSVKKISHERSRQNSDLNIEDFVSNSTLSRYIWTFMKFHVIHSILSKFILECLTYKSCDNQMIDNILFLFVSSFKENGSWPNHLQLYFSFNILNHVGPCDHV